MSCFLRKIKHSEEADKRTFMMRNGEILLENLIKSCSNKRNPIRCFCAEELETAMNNYDGQKVITKGLGYELYKGFLQDHSVSIMKFVDSDYATEFCFNNIVFASQMSHKNVLRLTGCCLETPNPILVFESVEYGTLADHIYHPCQPLPWRQRLKIAMEIAYAIAYLHVGFSRPIVFRTVNPSKVLFDEQCVAKLFDFSCSECIPEGETHIKGRVMGNFGYLSTEYIATGDCNEKSDVYSFGMLLLVLLTGQRVVDRSRPQEIEDEFVLSDRVKKYIAMSRFNEIVDPIIVGEGLCSAKEKNLQAFTELAFNCLSESAKDRPTIVDVTKQLRQMLHSEKPSCAVASECV